MEIAKSDIKIEPYEIKGRINWTLVFDGKPRTFKAGEDYTTDDAAFVRRVIAAAKKAEVRVGFGVDEPEGQVTVQALL